MLCQWATACETVRTGSCWALQRVVVVAARRINNGYATEDSFEQPWPLQRPQLRQGLSDDAVWRLFEMTLLDPCQQQAHLWTLDPQ